jgi:dolichol-phosphate mannosyltransferase
MLVAVDVSIVIPTFNEGDNVRLITEEIKTAMAGEGLTYEIIFVDDSADNTPLVLEQLSRRFPEIRHIHRLAEKGLATAVACGFKLAQGSRIIVMDADLQHPPELIPLICQRLASADVVIPSRFIAGGSDGGLSALRKFISWTARMIGCLALKKIRPISDCTGGFFGLNHSVIEGVTLDPVGWKILLEVLVKGRYQTVHQIPYSFAARSSGESKMSFREQCNYLRHIARLVASSPEDYRFYCFCMVGALGVLVNLLSLSLLLIVFHFDNLAASLGASFIAMLHNFLLNDNLTWRRHKQATAYRCLIQFPQFILISGVGIAITTLFAHAFLLLGGNIYLGQLAGIAISTYWNYTANNSWTWPHPAEKFTTVVTYEYPAKLFWDSAADYSRQTMPKRGDNE